MDNNEHCNISKWLSTWFKLSVLVLIGLITLKALGLQVFIEIDYDGESFLTALTEIETYYIPLGLLLLYFLTSWLREWFFSSKDS